MAEDLQRNGPEHAIPNRELTQEFIEKWDQDLQTITSLDNLAESFGGHFIVRGGIVVAAYAGGVQKRAHNDIDVIPICNNYLLFHSLIERK